jgi:hypothetical protein
VLKINGYNLEHNSGHGKETLASVLVTPSTCSPSRSTPPFVSPILLASRRYRARAAIPLLRVSATVTVYVFFPDRPHHGTKNTTKLPI